MQDIVKGCYGRKIAYTNVEQITEANVLQVIGNCIGTFYYNKTVIKYLWDYYKGDQPILYRQKVTNEDITNRIVENHAYEIVQFKVGQTYGEPIQFISRKDDEVINFLFLFYNVIHGISIFIKIMACLNSFFVFNGRNAHMANFVLR